SWTNRPVARRFVWPCWRVRWRGWGSSSGDGCVTGRRATRPESRARRTMPRLISRSIVEADDLPRPPGAPERTHGVDPVIVIAVVVAVLGSVVLIAWLLKPLVARRLTEAEVAEVGAEPGQAESAGLPRGEEWDSTRAAAVAASEASEAEPAVEPRSGRRLGPGGGGRERGGGGRGSRPVA